MGKTIKKIESAVNRFPQQFYLSKIRYGEETAIRKKKTLYAEVQWTNAQRRQFDEYWIKNYGKQIRPWWHQLYQSINGVYHFDYYPEVLFSTKLEPYLNPQEYSRVFSDKSLTQTLFGQIAGVAFPEMILLNCDDKLFTEDRRLINRYDAENITEELFDYAVKTVFSEPQLDNASAQIDMPDAWTKSIKS